MIAPIIRYSCMAGVAISAGLAFGPLAALAGFTAMTVLSLLP